MSRITETKLQRAKMIPGIKNPYRSKILGYEPPLQREYYKVVYGRTEMKALMSIGQTVNPRKEYERKFR